MFILKDKFIKISLLFTIVFIVILGVTLIGISYVPFQFVKAEIEKYSKDGRADSFTAVFFEKSVIRLRFFAIALFLVSIWGYFARNKLLKIIFNIKSSTISFFKEVSQYFHETIRTEDKLHLFSLLVIFLIAIAVRLAFLFQQPLFHDEAWTFVSFASKPLTIGLSYYSSTNNHLLNTLLTHIAYILLGNKLWVIRLPAFLAGILMVPASYLVIRMFFNKYAALMTAGLVASSAALISFSAQSRGYTILCLIVLLIFALSKYLMRNRNPAAWLAFAILAALGFYTIPIMLYPYGIIVIWFFISIMLQDTNLEPAYLLRSLFVSLIITVILTLTLYAPVIVVSGLKSIVSNKNISPSTWSYFIPTSLLVFNELWAEWNDSIPTLIKYSLVTGFLISIIYHKRLSMCRVPILLSIVIWCLPVLIIQRVTTYTRIWHFLLPLYLGLACAGVSYILICISQKFSNYRSLMFTVLTLVLTIWLSLNVVTKGLSYTLQENTDMMDAEQITLSLKQHLKSGDRVLINFESYDHIYPLLYYFDLYGVPSDYLKTDLTYSNRIFVLSKSYKSKFELINRIHELLNKQKVNTSIFSHPTLINCFRMRNIYEINRL